MRAGRGDVCVYAVAPPGWVIIHSDNCQTAAAHRGRSVCRVETGWAYWNYIPHILYPHIHIHTHRETYTTLPQTHTPCTMHIHIPYIHICTHTVFHTHRHYTTHTNIRTHVIHRYTTCKEACIHTVHTHSSICSAHYEPCAEVDDQQ